MIFPFDSLSAEARPLGLFVGTLVGFGFGFVLERAGFGRAPKLAAQFYGTDLTVLKVMFGAIVTALLGLVVLSGVGLLDLRAVANQAASATYLWPMIVGGFALGVGFIVSGYCPGTSFVAAASGKLDGLVVVAGVVLGQVAWAELEWRPIVARFHDSGDLGHLFIYDLLHVPAAIVALAVVAMAVGAFLLADFIDQRPGGRAGRAVFAALVGTALAGVALLALPSRGEARPRGLRAITALDLAHRVFAEPWKLRVLDLRPAAACAAKRIPGSECVEKPAGDPVREVVLVTEAGGPVPPAAGRIASDVRVLAGGFRAWEELKLEAPDPGAPPPAPAAAPSPPRKKAEGGGCGG